ncbi:SRPBCC family protein [Kitasatospora sp. NPDC056783]|uniref:SRPBCC family protein n=1 Tax=Kitasatospora sp. NPDC056783 TaxID=3345943 RepID=UPI0036B38A35
MTDRAHPADDTARTTEATRVLDLRRHEDGGAVVRHTSPAPHGVGTTRQVTALGTLRLREEFIHWDEGTRHAFQATQASLPPYRRFGEDCLLEPLPSGGTRLTWTFAYEPNPLLRRPAALAGAPGAAFLRTLIADTERHFGAA